MLKGKVSFSRFTACLMALIFLSSGEAIAQVDLGNLSGNFQLDAQYYIQDTLIGTPEFPEKLGSNSYMNLLYTRGNFRAGVRFEAYLPTLQGYFRERGGGLGHRFIEYNSKMLDVTLGTFYEQFGSGMSLRTYEQWGLGFDNALDGARVRLRPYKGIEIKGLVARQRTATSPTIQNPGEGLVRAADLELSLNDLIPAMDSIKTRIRLGGSFVSRFQKDADPIYILPQNVGLYGARLNFSHTAFNFGVEYVHKINDPSTVNNLIYKPGSGLLVQATYSQKGLGISLTAKRIDNLDFRSDRSATFNNLNLNYLPPQSKQHTYRLPTLFPYATQAMGEMAIQLEILYKIKSGSKIGGKYGTNLTFNFSRIHGLKTTPSAEPEMGYTAPFFGASKNVYFQDINLEISRKFNKVWKATVQYVYITYDKSLFNQLTGLKSSHEVHSHVAVADVSYHPHKKHTLRLELQHAYTKQEFGSWAMALLEYNFSPHWFVSFFDEWNYGNDDVNKRLHYYSGLVGFNYNNYRITGGYGRQRAGVLCVGGVCRQVPASNGFSLSITGSF